MCDLYSEQAADSMAEGIREKKTVPIPCPEVVALGSRWQLEQSREGTNSGLHFAGISDPSW